MSGFLYGHNPNAGTLDGLDSAAFALLGGRAGGQVLQGGTAANEDLTLEGTAHATKTTSYVILQPTGGNVGIGANAVIDVGSTRFLHHYADATADGHNLFLGMNAGNLTSSPGGGASSLASQNIGLGTTALANTTTGYKNIAIGATALVTLTTGYENVAVGDAAGVSLTNGFHNTLIGSSAGLGITAAKHDTAIGFGALYADADGYANTALGYLAMFSHTGGQQAHGYNTGIGVESFYGNTTGQANTGLGYATGFQNVSGSYNLFLGNSAGKYETGSYKLFIDTTDRGSEANARATSLIYGVFAAEVANQELALNAGKMGFFGHVAAAQPLKANHNNWAALSDVVAALVEIGILDAA